LRKLIVALLAVTTVATSVFIVLAHRHPAGDTQRQLPALSQTYVPVQSNAPLLFPPLVTSDGRIFGPAQLQGHWSLIFFGFTTCPLVCPRTLSVLTATAHIPASGISSGDTQALFVSVDPEHDTPERMKAYLKHFGHIMGLTGNREVINRFSREIGAGYQSVGSAIDHSTSLFVVDPKGRLVGILLHPGQPTQVAADFAEIRRSFVIAPGPAASIP
jgi:protein SCO1/2